MSFQLKLNELVEAAGAAIDSINLNDVSAGRYRGRRLRVKRRKKGSEYIAGVANLFFPLADAGLSVWADPKEWQDWEILCYELLNGDQFAAWTHDPRTVCQDKLPGRNLRKLQECGALNVQVIEAAAREIRRAHGLRCPRFGRPWSHGDLHLGNVIYDERTDRARLIDFEIVHDRTLSAVARHADDLLAFLQDMAGRVSVRQWLKFALGFLDAYGRRRVIGRLRELLVVPNGAPGLWWGIRTGFCNPAKLKRRFRALHHALEARAQAEARNAPLREHRPRRSPAQAGRNP